jgi:retron-type reverse transcriptase
MPGNTGTVRQYSRSTKNSPKDDSELLDANSPLITVKGGRVEFRPLNTDKLIHAICHVDVLMLAYELVKSKPGNMTPGSNKETLDGMDKGWIERTSKLLRAGRFKLGLARRTLIPKVGKPGDRPLTMESPREKVVQKAMAMVLNEVFEPCFLKYSHGFRPKRGCHSALQMIDQYFRGSK